MPTSPRPWIDVTMHFGATAGTWPGDTPFRTEWTARLGDLGPLGVNLSSITSSPHNGTHADAPYHVLADGGKSETLPIEVFQGPCVIVDATKSKDLVPSSMATEILRSQPQRVLFKTRPHPHGQKFPKPFIGLEPELVKALVASNVRLIGTDAPSVDRADLNGLKAHRTLFQAGAYNLENLELAAVAPGSYELNALPLLVNGLCAAPVRALVRPMANHKVP